MPEKSDKLPSFEAKLAQARIEDAREKLEKKEIPRPPETLEDLHAKEVFSSVLPEMKDMAKQDTEALRKMVTELRERELSFSNFVSPENMLGLSTLVRGDGNTFSSDRLETVENVSETANLRFLGLVRLQGMIASGARLDTVKKDPLVSMFLASPEGKLVQGIVFGNVEAKTLESQYYLDKARELKSGIIRGDELAQEWYDRLKGTPLEAVAEKEKMSLGDRSLRKGREFANSMLGLDSLAMLVAGAGFGRVAGMLVSNSNKLRNLSMSAVTAMNESKIARMSVPGVNALKSTGAESGLKVFAKGGANFLAEIAKGFAYTEVARSVGGEKMAHAISYPLMFIPGAKGQFEGSLQVSFANNPANFTKFAEWVKVKYESPTKLEQAIVAGWTEQMRRQGGKVGNTEAEAFKSEAKNAVATLYGTHLDQPKPVATALGVNVPAQKPYQAGLAENMGSSEAQTIKNVPETRSNTVPAIQEAPPTQMEAPKQPEVGNGKEMQAKAPTTPPEKLEIRTEKDFEAFVRTVFEEHGALTLKNQNEVVQNLLYKWKEYSRLAVKNGPKPKEVPKGVSESGSFLDADTMAPIDARELKKALVSYVDGMRTVSELMEGIDDWALMSSNSLFLAKKEYRYVPDDFDISIDRKDLAKAWQQLQKLVASGKVENVHKKAIVEHEKLYPNGGDVPDADIPGLIESGNFKIVFDLKTKTGKPIETEFFVEDKGRGFTQIGHMNRTIESVSIKGKEIKYLSEKDAVEGYLVNLADEGPKNSVENFAKALEAHMEQKAQGKVGENELFKPPKAKDGTRNLNVLFYMEDVRVRSPEQIFPALMAVAGNFRKQGGEKLSPALESVLKPENLEAVRNDLKAVIRDFRKLPEQRSIQTLPDFEAFRDKLIVGKQEIAEIYLKASKNQLTKSEKLIFEEKLSIMKENLGDEMKLLGRDNLSFAYYYELHKFQFGFVGRTLEMIETGK